MVRGIANSKIGFGDLILLLRYFFKLKVSTHSNFKDGITKKLDLGKNQENVYAGDATSQFKASTPFHFLGKDD